MKTNIFNAISKIRYLAVLMVLTMLSTQVWGETMELTFEGSGTFPYNSAWSVTSGSVNTSYHHGGSKSCQFSATAFVVKTNDKITGTISNIKYYATKTSTNTTNTPVYIQTSTDGTNWTTVNTFNIASTTKGTFTEVSQDLTANNVNVYVRISRGGSSTANRVIDDIIITYTATSSCANKVTLTKAAATNGSFVLKEGSASGTEIASGGTVDNCDANAIVYIVPTPNTGYKVNGTPTATNSASVTADGSNFKITYTKGASKASTVTVSFTAQSYTVTLNKNGGTGGTASVTATYNATCPAIGGAVPTKTGYDFTGYYSGSGGTGTKVVNADLTWVATASGYTSSSKWVKAATTTLYAGWTEKPITRYVTQCCTDWATPSLSGYSTSLTSGGTTTIAVGSGTVYGTRTFESSNPSVLTVNSSGVITAVGAGTATVTCTWTGNATYCEKSVTTSTITVTGNVTVVFDKNGGTGTMANQSIPYNTATKLTANAFTAPTCKEFYGWADTKAKADAGTRDYTDGQSVTLTAGKTLYAVWKDKTYTITKGTKTGASTFTLSTTSITCGATLTITCAADASHKGNPTVTATGTHGDITVVSATSVTIANVQSAMTVNISYPAKETFTITWKANGTNYTTGSPTTSVTEGNAITNLPSNPTSCSDTYTTFVGWFPVAAGSESAPTGAASLGTLGSKAVAGTTVPTGNTTYYAVWADGGGEITRISGITSGAYYYIKGAYYAKYLYFDASSTGNKAGTSKSTTAEATQVRVIYAGTAGRYYIKAGDYYIHAGGSNGQINVTATETYNTISEQTDDEGDPTLRITSGTNTSRSIQLNNNMTNFGSYANTQNDVSLYSSASGYISSCCALPAVTNVTVGVSSATAIYLNWQNPASLSGITKFQIVQTNTAGGVTAGTVVKDNIALGSANAKHSNVTISGLTECTEYHYAVVSYGDCQTYSAEVIAQPYGSAKTLTYDYNGGSTTDMPATFVTTCTSNVATLPTPTKDKYDFKGWYTATSGGTLRGAAGASYTVTANETVHAQWTQNTLNFNMNGKTGTAPTAIKDRAGSIVSLPAPPKVAGFHFNGWYTATSGGTRKGGAGDSYTLSATKGATETLYAQWTAASITVTNQEFYATTNVAFSETFSITATTDEDGVAVSVTARTPSGNGITASIDGTTVTVTMPGKAAEGDYTATLSFTAAGATTRTATVTIHVQSLAVQTFTKNTDYFTGDILCADKTPSPALTASTTYPFTLTNAMYKSAGVIATLGEFNGTDTYLYDAATGSKVSDKSLPRAISGAGIVSFSLSNHIGDMVAGKKYRIEWINNDGVMKSSTGVPYQDVSYTFTYSTDCSKPIALDACPITKTGFTANWIPNGSASQTLNVYTYDIGTTICDVTFTADEKPTAYYAQGSNSTNDDSKNPVFLGLLYGQSWASPTSGILTWQSDSYGGWRICNTSKRWAVFSAQCTTAGTYTVTFTGRAVSYASHVTIYKTDAYGEPIGAAIGTFDLPTSKTVIETTVALSSGNRVAIVPDLYVSSGGPGVTGVIGLTVQMKGPKKYVASSPISGISSSTSSRAVTGLTAGTTYYYTISNGSESNEMTVTTRSGDPSIEFSPSKATLQTDVNGNVTTTVEVAGDNLTPCDITGILAGTNASYFAVDKSGLVYDVTTGKLTGSIEITYHPTAEGSHTANYTISGMTPLQIEGHSCPSGFGSQATSAASITKNSATARWSQSTTGYLMLSENTRMNTELLINPGFEQDGLGWDGVPSSMMPTSGSRQTAIKALGRSGNCIIMTGYGQGSYVYPNTATGKTSDGILGAAVYGEKTTLQPGTYTISCYVHNASTSSALSDAAYGSDCELFMGFANDFPTKSYATARRSICPATGTNIKGKTGWIKIEDTFTLTEATTGYIFLAYKTGGPSYYAADDFSLKCTGVVPGSNFSEYPISSATSKALTDLKPSTSYSYYVVNASGCASNIVSFTTLASADAVSIEGDPNPVSVTGPKGSTTRGTVSITALNAYSTILFNVGDDCGGRLSLLTPSMSEAGGSLVFAFTPLEGDAQGATGSCTISATTLGLATPYEITVNWTVSAGVDQATPTVEVVELDNSSLTVEHNIENVSENSEIRIQLDRELTDEEIDENVGDEIFFSKYYEAYMHKKLWAIYNPTNEKISLKGMQVWKSKGGRAGASNAWNRSEVVYLDSYGKEKGFIGPKEEIIIYASQNSYTCESGKTDMTEWNGYPNSGPLSYSGDDALLLVRKVRTGEADYRTPPATSVTGDALSWRTIVDDDETEWTMLDIIGARAANNMPDGSGIKHWTWKNCKNGTTETGDDYGWVGYGLDISEDSWSSNTCNSQPAGYLLSTNRCLLVRLYTVKSGNNAVNVNVGNMYTLGISPIQPEWKGAHVPTEPSSKQDEISCENFAFVGGYDYSNYYNAWKPLEEDEYLVGDRRSDGSYLVSDVNVPRFWCNKVRIEIIEHETINGVDVSSVRHYQDYRVPIVVDEDAYTNTAKFFGNPNNPSYSGADENVKKGEWSTICAECDVVVRDNATLTHRATGGNLKNQFNNVQVYSGAKLMVADDLTLTLHGLQMRGINDETSYAIINNGAAGITVDSIVHVKRIDDAHWYRFSLPYKCDIATIRQLNGKSMGIYGTDWVIKYYDGAERQAQDNFAGTGVSSKHWKKLGATDVLQPNQGYIIGLYTTEWEGQSKSIFFPPKSPKSTNGYTEGGSDTKTANVYAYTGDGNQMNRGWNFVGSPFISLFNPAGLAAARQGMNNTTVMIKGQYGLEEYTNTDRVYVSVPTDASMRYYEQREAASEKLEPFLPYFVQVAGTVAETKTISYAKGGRTLTKAPRRERQAEENQHVGFDLMIVAQDSTFDVAGIALSDDYEIGYEAQRDLYKMARNKNQTNLYTIAPDQEKMAFIALPMSNATDIPLGIYVPEVGKYTVMVTPGSDLTDIDAIYLKYNGEQVANLLFDEYELDAEGYGDIDGFTVTVVVRKRVPTEVEIAAMDEVGVLLTPAGIEVVGLPQGAEVQLVDVVGRTLAQQKTTDESVQFNAPATGVYNIVVRYGNERKVIKTVIK